MGLHERLLWFVIGAAVAGTAVLFETRHPFVERSEPPVKVPVDYQPIAAQLERIEQRLAVIETTVGGRKGSAVPTISSDKAAAPAPAVTVSQKQAGESAAAIVREAIARGTWSRATAAEFNGVAGDMRGEDRFELVRQLSVAINEGRLKIEPGAEFR